MMRSLTFFASLILVSLLQQVSTILSFVVSQAVVSIVIHTNEHSWIRQLQSDTPTEALVTKIKQQNKIKVEFYLQTGFTYIIVYWTFRPSILPNRMNWTIHLSIWQHLSPLNEGWPNEWKYKENPFLDAWLSFKVKPRSAFTSVETSKS